MIKNLYREANIEKIECGVRGAVITFRDNKFGNPQGLLTMIKQEGDNAKVRPDQKILFLRDWTKPTARLEGAAKLVKEMARVAGL